jgi:hypothetical protein
MVSKIFHRRLFDLLEKPELDRGELEEAISMLDELLRFTWDTVNKEENKGTDTIRDYYKDIDFLTHHYVRMMEQFVIQYSNGTI